MYNCNPQRINIIIKWDLNLELNYYYNAKKSHYS
jgi:hypothetical protein